MLTDELIRGISMANGFTVKPGLNDLKAYVYEAARAIESAACADRDARIAELEAWQAEHWTALEIITNYMVSKDLLLVLEDGGPEAAARNVVKSIAELEQRNRDLYEDVQRFKEHALNEKDARIAELERELAEARKDAERLSFIESMGCGIGWIARNSTTGRGYRLHNDKDGTHITARGAIDAAMKDQQ